MCPSPENTDARFPCQHLSNGNVPASSHCNTAYLLRGDCFGPTQGIKGHSANSSSPIQEPHSDGCRIIRIDINPQKCNICIKDGASLGTDPRRLLHKLVDFGLLVPQFIVYKIGSNNTVIRRTK